MCLSKLEITSPLSLEVAGFIAIIHGQLMPNQVQIWLRFLKYGEDNCEPMQVSSSNSPNSPNLLPELLAPLYTYMYRLYGYKSKGYFLFLYQHALNMLITYCPQETQQGLLKWISDFLTSPTVEISHYTHVQESSNYLGLELINLA